ncbi:rubredoxin [Magnetofaba australis]|uniref:Rubredoxin n=1 Tax=Magnetofaba australis IT-1 TaxID=1434232 RepID=A0A1Y2K6J1_9PROT|nr:rubredoxin [Magnetofaba australis]OSM05284.1 putative rubredoxin-type Fe(Cys)4 protein [Magnetofaba australis IT-1]
MKWHCPICSYVYDEDEGIPALGIQPGTLFKDLPDDWECPECPARKDQFVPYDDEEADDQDVIELDGDEW